MSDLSRINDILSFSPFCHVALCDNNEPYCVPMCFAYHEGRIYLHSADEGKKI
ncbi:MAG: hypothetical protein GXY48_06855 [Methanomicrobiales archaeon]|nr:hypothetical protein [Methanomicrobiales archaeon]